MRPLLVVKNIPKITINLYLDFVNTSVLLMFAFLIMQSLAYIFGNVGHFYLVTKSKSVVLHPVQQPGSYWDRSSALPLVGV